MKYVGIDLGGTNIAVGIVDENGTILHQSSSPTLAKNGSKDVIHRIADAVLKLLEETNTPQSDIASVGIGCPGAIDKSTGTILSACNLAFENVPIVTELKELLKLPVYIENDANCAALAEATVGAAAHSQSCVMITLGTGIGGAIIINDKIYDGFNGLCGEFGHMTICADGELCSCGRRGCLETYASATALARDACRTAKKMPSSLLWSFRERDGSFSARTVFEAAKHGDATAQNVLDQYINYLSIGLRNIIKILQPETIVIGGGVSNAGDDLIIPLSETVLNTTYGDYVSAHKKTRIVAAKYKNSAGIIGAALLGKEIST